jgi:hypothetical protein
MNYLYDTHDNVPGAAGIGFANFFANIGAAGTAFSFFPADVQREIVSALTYKGDLTADLRGPGAAVAPNTLVGIDGPGCRNLFDNTLIQPAAANAGGDITLAAGIIPVNKYHLYFNYTSGAGAQAAAANAFPAAPGSLLQNYTHDMSVAGSEEEIHWTCGRIADPEGRYGIGFVGAGGLAAAPAINAGATGLTYKQFILMLLTQLMAHYDSIVAADKAVLPLIARDPPAPTNITSLLKRTYYMTADPAYFAATGGAPVALARVQPGPGGGLIPPANSTPIVQSIVRYVKSCLQ